MPLLEDLTKANLKQFGLQGFSFTMPATTQKWADEDSPTPAITFTAGTLSLAYNAGNWLAPFGGHAQKVNTSDKKIQVSLQQADGAMVHTEGLLLRLFPQAVLKLKRLAALRLEAAGTGNPRRAQGIPTRQVPAFLFFAGTSSSATEGLLRAGADTGMKGTLQFYDEQGYLLHPLYVASLAKSLAGLYPVLDVDDSNALSNQLEHVTGLQSNSNTVRLVGADGRPYAGTHIQGMAAVNAAIGLFSLDTPTDTTLKGKLTRAAATGETGSFPPAEAQRLVLGNVTYGRLHDSVSFLPLPTALGTNALAHDFFTVRVVALEQYLLGAPPSDFNGTRLEPRPVPRMHEPISFPDTGNAVMGRLSTLFSGAPTEALCAAPAIDERLPLPPNETAVHWPAFPALPSGFTPEPADVPFPADLKLQLQTHSRADFIEAGGAQPTDVLLKLTGLPRGAAVRVYHRQFLAEAVVKRGDGAGGACFTEVPPFSGRTLNGELPLLLKDPLGLKRPDGTVTVPTDPKLIIDIMIVRQEPQQKRLYGAVSLPVQMPAVAAPPPLPFNVLNGVGKKGVSKAAILGLQQAAVTSIDLSSLNATLNTVLSLSGETQPRDAGRQATMARRDLLAAALKSGRWEALLSGGPVNGSLHNAQQDLGNPGAPGGRETATVGVYTQQAQLAYDIARAAFRRTTSFYDRIGQLAGDNWNEPAANAPLAEGAVPTASTGTFAGAVLQTIAPYCETPELALFKSLVDSNIDSIPATFDALVDLVTGWISGITTSGLPTLLQGAAGRLQTALANTLDDLKDDSTLSESKKERLYNELKRELSAACYGRRDAQWALREAIKNARHAIYIETPGFSFTRSGSTASYAVDLVQELTDQLGAKPGLRVILCVPRQPDYDPTYEQWIRSEVKERYTLFQTMPDKQIVVFHPVGFPGRPSNLEQSVVIVDDQWALVGSSAFRRRGLTFDGGSDLVCTDLETVHGHAPSIRNLRKNLLKQRLGIPLSDTSSSRALQLEQVRTAFSAVRQMLVSGGLGKIEPLWNGRTQGVTYTEPTIDRGLANPEGLEFNGLAATVFAAFAGLAK